MLILAEKTMIFEGFSALQTEAEHQGRISAAMYASFGPVRHFRPNLFMIQTKYRNIKSQLPQRPFA